jgi:hypothetical protein
LTSNALSRLLRAWMAVTVRESDMEWVLLVTKFIL